jgi:hypothetical protein
MALHLVENSVGNMADQALNVLGKHPPPLLLQDSSLLRLLPPLLRPPGLLLSPSLPPAKIFCIATLNLKNK